MNIGQLRTEKFGGIEKAITMQELQVIKTYTKSNINEYSLYCKTCDSVFDKEMFLQDIPYFTELHRVIHRKFNLDSPDIPDNLGLERNYIELSTEN